jgi:hypothetical protein
MTKKNDERGYLLGESVFLSGGDFFSVFLH